MKKTPIIINQFVNVLEITAAGRKIKVVAKYCDDPAAAFALTVETFKRTAKAEKIRFDYARFDELGDMVEFYVWTPPVAKKTTRKRFTKTKKAAAK